MKNPATKGDVLIYGNLILSYLAHTTLGSIVFVILAFISLILNL